MSKAPTIKKTPSSPSKFENQEHRDIFEYALKADALNTQRAYTFDWKHFLSWCAKRNNIPLPCVSNELASYLKFCAQTLELKVSTIERRLYAISEAHQRNGYPSPTTEWVVRNTMRRLKREYGSPAHGKKPILVDDLKKMISACDTNKLSGLRDRAILLVGFSGAFRRGELVSLDVEDLSKTDEGIVILIRGGKTDQKHEGRKIGIPFGRDPLTCPVKALCEWLEASRIYSGSIFRPMNKFGRPRSDRLSGAAVAEIVKKYCVLIGKKSLNFSGHSLRAGFATSAAMAGASERSIQKQTGHASLIVLRRYIREAEIFRENAFRSLDL